MKKHQHTITEKYAKTECTVVFNQGHWFPLLFKNSRLWLTRHLYFLWPLLEQSIFISCDHCWNKASLFLVTTAGTKQSLFLVTTAGTKHLYFLWPLLEKSIFIYCDHCWKKASLFLVTTAGTKQSLFLVTPAGKKHLYLLWPLLEKSSLYFLWPLLEQSIFISCDHCWKKKWSPPK